jgi:hypothetical protein
VKAERKEGDPNMQRLYIKYPPLAVKAWKLWEYFALHGGRMFRVLMGYSFVHRQFNAASGAYMLLKFREII